MINEEQERKIREFLSGTNWTAPNWNDKAQVSELLDILKAFNNDPQTAIRYWKEADRKSVLAVRKNYSGRLEELGLSIETKISNQTMMACFNGDQSAVDYFKQKLKLEGQEISKQVFYDNFTAVVLQILGQKHSIQ